MTEAGLPPEAVKFLRRFRWALSSLPQADRNDIAAEVAVHINDRIASGATIDEILAGFDRPEKYARSFIIEHDQTVAVATRRLAYLLPALTARATENINAFAATATLAIMWVVTFLLAVVALMKIIDPAHIGLWRSDTEFYLGYYDHPENAAELLGLWIFPITFGVLISAVALSRFLALYVLKRLP